MISGRRSSLAAACIGRATPLATQAHAGRADGAADANAACGSGGGSLGRALTDAQVVLDVPHGRHALGALLRPSLGLTTVRASGLQGTRQVPDPFPSKRQEERMTDTTVKKVSSAHSPVGEQGQIYLASGKRVSMRLWRDEEPTQNKPSHKHEYEVVGYVIAGRAELEIEGQTVRLEPGDSWVVPAGAEHTYRILETFTAVEATAPPAQVHGREQS